MSVLFGGSVCLCWPVCVCFRLCGQTIELSSSMIVISAYFISNSMEAFCLKGICFFPIIFYLLCFCGIAVSLLKAKIDEVKMLSDSKL